MTGAAASRLARLLALVPYLTSHPGAPVAEVAAVFGITPEELQSDHSLLVMCGLPGYTPGDLVEVVYEGDAVTLRQADIIARPLRLTPDEALALVVAARTLAQEPGLAERDALDRALVKLEAAVGPSLVETPDVVDVALEPEGEMLARAEDALARGRRVHLRYHSFGRDAVTERDVDPMRVVNVEGRWYLEGWCRRVEDVRLFRLDRVLAAEVLDVAAEVPAAAERRDLADGLFRPSADDPLVELEVDAAARWVADYYPCETVTELSEGGLRLGLRVRDDGWLRRLALRLGPHGRIVTPVELADAVRHSAAEALAAYGAH